MNKELIQFLLDKAGGLIKEYSPEALGLAYSVVRIEAVSQILYSIFFVCFGLYLARWGEIKAAIIRGGFKPSYNGETCVDANIVTIVSYIVGYLTAFFSFLSLADIWNWVALFDPSIYIAHSLFSKS